MKRESLYNVVYWPKGQCRPAKPFILGLHPQPYQEARQAAKGAKFLQGMGLYTFGLEKVETQEGAKE